MHGVNGEVILTKKFFLTTTMATFSSAFSRSDPRRFMGPEGAFDYRDLAINRHEQPKKAAKGEKPKTSSDAATRPLCKVAHRSLLTLRINYHFVFTVLKTDVLSQCQGSAYVEQGGTKVLCGVYGPREIPRRSDFSMKGILTVNFRLAPFSQEGPRVKEAHNNDQSVEREISLVLQEALKATVCLVG